MGTPSMDSVRELNVLRTRLGLPKPIFRHHYSKRKFYTVIMLPMEKAGDLSAFGSKDGFPTRKEANSEAALNAIKGLIEFHQLEYHDVNHDALLQEREEKLIAQTGVKEIMDKRDALQQDYFELTDAYNTLQERCIAMKYIYEENSRLEARIWELRKEIDELKEEKKLKYKMT